MCRLRLFLEVLSQSHLVLRQMAQPRLPLVPLRLLLLPLLPVLEVRPLLLLLLLLLLLWLACAHFRDEPDLVKYEATARQESGMSAADCHGRASAARIDGGACMLW